MGYACPVSLQGDRYKGDGKASDSLFLLLYRHEAAANTIASQINREKHIYIYNVFMINLIIKYILTNEQLEKNIPQENPKI